MSKELGPPRIFYGWVSAKGVKPSQLAIAWTMSVGTVLNLRNEVVPALHDWQAVRNIIGWAGARQPRGTVSGR